MEHVAIPVDFFLREAQREYYNYRERLVTELIQNSADAGSTEINLTFAPDGYECIDNGRGMTKERMVSALLTMGGTAKENGSTGGFGAAKKILLFAHESYRIHSLGTLAAGKCLQYEFEPCSYRKGTLVSAKYADGFRGDPEEMVRIARAFLYKCNLKSRVWINGEEFINWTHTRVFRTDPLLGAISSQKLDENCVYVRHNGLFMFQRYVSGIKKIVIVDVKDESVDVFTQNRDGLRGQYDTALSKLISEITVDKVSFDREKTRKFKITGEVSFFRHLLNVIEGEATPRIVEVVKQMSAASTGFSTADLYRELVSRVSNDPLSLNVLEKYSGELKQIPAADFHFDLGDSKYRVVPAMMIPNVGKKKYTALAALWKVCVAEVLKANLMDQNFRIGFTLESSTEATYQKSQLASYTIHTYLINPQTSKVVKVKNKREQVMNVLLLAAHEIAHTFEQYHDEDFVNHFHTLLNNVLVKGDGWTKLAKKSKKERV